MSWSQYKLQHNCVSDFRTYSAMSWPRIAHEYLLCWKKCEAPLIVLLGNIAKEQQAKLTGTWKNLVRLVVQNLGGKASLDEIYSNVARHAPDKLTNNPNWQAKIRQTLNTNVKMFTPIDRGVWSLV